MVWWCDQVQMCQLADQRVVVDQLKQITSTLSNLVGAGSTADIQQLTRLDMDRYLSLTQSFSDRANQIDSVYRQANDVRTFLCIYIGCWYDTIRYSTFWITCAKNKGT